MLSGFVGGLTSLDSASCSRSCCGLSWTNSRSTSFTRLPVCPDMKSRIRGAGAEDELLCSSPILEQNHCDYIYIYVYLCITEESKKEEKRREKEGKGRNNNSNSMMKKWKQVDSRASEKIKS